MSILLTRKHFLQQTAFAVLGNCILPGKLFAGGYKEMVMTVNGPIPPYAMRFTLPHEHVLCDFAGADTYSRDHYKEDNVYDSALLFLQAVKSKGCFTFVDCTPAYIGRDAGVLKRLSAAAGLNIITNTGYYGAAAEKFLPKHAYTETAAQIADRWIEEWTDGIEGTTIKPGFIKSGTDNAPLTATQQKMIEAAALTHLTTGLTIAVHTGNGEAAKEQLRILAAKAVDPSAYIWVHAQNETDTSHHIAAARNKCWVSFDGVNTDNIKVYLQLLQNMKSAKLLERVLVSQDSGWYTAGEPNGGNYKDYNTIFTDYNTIFTHFIPALQQNGFTEAEVKKIFVTNPAKAFTVKVRKL